VRRHRCSSAQPNGQTGAAHTLLDQGGVPSKLRDERIVVRMASDPEPHYYIALDPAKRTMMQPDTDRVDGLRGVHAAKTQAWVTGVLLEQRVRPPSRTLGFLWQGRKRLPEAMGGPRLHNTESLSDRVFFTRNSSRASPASRLSSS